jgi:uncharacterized HAD superfamily protein
MHDRFDVDPAEMKKFMRELFDSNEFWESCDAFDENINAFNSWCAAGRVHIVTGRGPDTRVGTTNWLENRGVFYDALLHVPVGKKLRACRHLGADFLIEDRVEEAITCAAHGLKTYLIERDYNVVHKDTVAAYENEKLNENIVWVKDYAEIGVLENL